MSFISAKLPTRCSLPKLLLLICSLSVSCDAYHPKAYITPLVQPNRQTVEMGTPLELEYSFQTSKDFPGLKKDLIVFCHFLDPHGVIRFVDDHSPPILTNQWKAADRYRYTRTLFIPENIPAGNYTIELGMYTPSGKGEAFALNAKRLSERSYDVGKLQIAAAPVETSDQFLNGWYQVEREPNNIWYHWRWIAKQASLKAKNPRADALLYLKADTDPGRFEEPQNVSVFLENRKLDQFAITTAEPVVKKYLISRYDLGNQENVQLSLEVDKTFMPASDGRSDDKRQLGIRVYCFYLGKARD
jgi:hypothetical protein